MKFYTGYRIKMAAKIKKKCKIITRTSGLIKNNKVINKAFNNYKLDFLAIGRKLIDDKFFLLRNKKNLKKIKLINQYKYCIN